MQFLRSDFSKAFLSAAKASSGKVKEVLGNVRLKVDDSKATFIGTDLEIAVMCTMAVDDVGSMDVLLPVDRMSSILALADGEKISLEQSDAGLVVQCGFAEYEMASINPQEFPAPQLTDGMTVEIPGNLLVAGIRSTEFCADTSSTRYQLGGVAFDLGGGVLTFVATDGRRLGAFELSVTSNEKITCIVPQRACRMLAGVCQSDTVATITLSMNNLMVQSGNCTVTTRLVEGRFPNWRQVVPSIKESVEVQLQATQFSIALQQAAIVSDKETRSVRMVMASGQIKLDASAEIGKSKVTVPVAYDGDEVDICFDYKFSTEFLKAVEAGSTVQLFLNGSNSPMVWRSGENYQYVVMPMAKT